jgi:uncharacterized protein (TIGR04141 family)
MADNKINKITVYKLKINKLSELSFQNYAEAKSDIFHFDGLEYSYQLFFLQQDDPKDAEWFSLFSSLSLDLAKEKVPKVLYAGFILIVKIKDSFYGVCGGLGHVALSSQPIENRFGIILAQKILSLPELKGLVQKDTSGTVNSLDRVFRGTYNPQGDLNNLKRVLTHIRGKLQSQNRFCEVIGKSIKAGDALSVTGKKSFKDIIAFLCQIEELWYSDKLQIDIPQLEHIRKKFEGELLAQLEKVLINTLCVYKDTPTDSLFLDNIEIGYLPDRAVKFDLVYNRISYEAETYDGVFQHASLIFKDVADDENSSAFHQMNVKVAFDDGQFETFPLYKLICGDISYQNNIYFLNNGLWYRAGAEYVSGLDHEINNIPFIESDKLRLNAWNNGNEDNYNNNHTTLSVLHKKLIHITGEKGGIEFCDLLKAEEVSQIGLIHVKSGSGAELRALFAQGYVSAQMYSNNNEFRDKVHTASFSGNLSQKDKQKVVLLKDKLKGDFTIVFAIYDNVNSHKVGTDAKTTTDYLRGTLTAFAKVDLLVRVADLRALGYHVAVTRIKPYPV